MKRIPALLLALVLCFGLFSGCSVKKEEAVEHVSVMDPADKIVPTEAIAPESMKTQDDFFGTFKNEGYTITIASNESNRMTFVIRSEPVGLTGYEWTFDAYFSAESNMVNYIGAVKTEINFDKNGAEKSRAVISENGAGRVIFTDADHLVWKSSSDAIEGSGELTRVK